MHTPAPHSTSRPRHERSRWGRLVLLGGMVIAVVGCRPHKRYDLIESELRTRERELSAAQSELRNTRQLNDAYQRQTRGPVVGDEGGLPFQPLKELILGTGTGGADNDSQPGDEALQVVLVPRDEDNSAVKVPATVTILAYEVARSGTKTAIGRWDVSPDQLRKTWRSGLFATGYYVLLQWDQLPSTEKVRLVVRMQTLDGRTFEADKDITVRVLPGMAIGTPGPPVYGPSPAAMPPTGADPQSWIPAPAVPIVPPPIAPPRIDELPPPTEVRSERPVRLAPARPDR